MKHVDLGVLDGDLLVFGGPYSNLQASLAVLEQAKAKGIAPDHVICTGDVVAYCGSPMETVQVIRESGCVVVAGNCEIQLAQQADDCGCGFEQGTTCDRLSAAWYAFAKSQLGEAEAKWMGALPDVATFTHHGQRYAVIHGGVRDVAQFIWETDKDAVFTTEWEVLEALIGPIDAILSGHSGLPFVREASKGRWINAGVVGMPPHDGKPQTRYAVLRKGCAQIETLDYDTAGAMQDMQAAGLPDDYRRALSSGYWPSEDVLPEVLRVAISDRG
ncbi:metallophosphoesterase family protein [Sulfitobacter donghicola]|uniref:Diadenosine tetraphosphatase n=1 Tax=Sulfitobacter donghicola DSW-25 = KCTC 12864 = JCM 14565 TaxID=1300350 RepID=A0A073IFR8_9RHOB|nr:metallophosphoesterase family protein [Sulfitobacter donghicola]KEJ88346.1 diadenosine tetraphosphatase [Sulfitobacter donghicola DSW-25 = KCTC 12864 = JCM 14565]